MMRPALERRIAENQTKVAAKRFWYNRAHVRLRAFIRPDNQALQSAFTSAGYKFANRTTVGEQEVVLCILNPEDSTSIGGDRN